MTRLHTQKLKVAADTIRTLSMDAVQAANSGHPGTPMALADLAVVLWTQFLRHNPHDPAWPDRDRFILSAGHASMLLYSLLHLSGYDLSLDEIKQFRQWGSKTPGHPEYGHTPGVETTTGPLGQGITNAVGFAMAEQWLAARFNRPGHAVVDHFTYVIASDGDIMEGIAHEAGALAGHLKLGKLIVFYDDNRITIDGSTDLALTEDVLARYRAYGWHTLAVEDGHNMDALYDAIVAARSETDRPTLIGVRTHIGYGSPNKQDTASAHGSPLGPEEIALTKAAYGWDLPPFTVPEDAYAVMNPDGDAAPAAYTAWHEALEAYRAAEPALAAAFESALSGELPADWDADMPTFTGENVATRNTSGQVLQAIAPRIPNLIGGSADLTGSNKTLARGMAVLSAENPDGDYIHYGVREHGMGGIMNGLALHGGIHPYGGTFLVFSDYMRGSIRLAALMGVPVVYVFTHDSIGLGEDGPTHQPIEHLAALRAMPNLHVVRPADGNETAAAWRHALTRRDGPTALVLSRQKVSTVSQAAAVDLAGYVVRDAAQPQALLLATGTEVEIAVAAHERLAADGVATRVVSLPSWELFEGLSADEQAALLPPHITARVSIEAGATLGWQRFIGQFGRALGLDRFGASAPYEELYAAFGLTAEAMAEAVRELLQ